MLDVRLVLRVSRPRFWIYIFGPFIVGAAGGADVRADFARPAIIVYGLFFLLPANLLIYGVNDIFDYETDRLNPKKRGYEAAVLPASYRSLSIIIVLLNVPLMLLGLYLAPESFMSLVAFLCFSIFYSAPPIRAKTKPVLDSLFNVLYVFPGILAFKVLDGSYPPISALVSAGLWTAAMHAYSAVPDIEADRAAGISTVATALGDQRTLLICLALYLASAALAFAYMGALAVILGLVYAVTILAAILSRRIDRVFSVYRYFPLINAACGFALFWFIVVYKFI